MVSPEPDLFQRAADYYSRYRPPYPESLLRRLRTDARLSGRGLLIDLGCGTGEIALPMSRYFREVLAVDPQLEMIEVGRAKAAEAGAGNIRWIVRRAEDLEVAPASVELVTIGAAFHWMDRPLVARRAMGWLVPRCCIAVLGSNSLWTGTAPWHPLVLEVIRRWFGERRRAGSGTYKQPSQRHEEVLLAAGFEDVQIRECRVRHTWTVDTFIGYLYSTSFCSKSVVGDAADEFENDLRRVLLEYDPSGRYEETIPFHCILGSRPSGPEGPELAP